MKMPKLEQLTQHGPRVRIFYPNSNFAYPFCEPQNKCIEDSFKSYEKEMNRL